MNENMNYPEGTIVSFKHSGRTYQGKVAYGLARNYGTPDAPDWYFQWTSETGGFGYVKQIADNVTSVAFTSS